MVYIYILELQDSKYYVGKSNDPDARIDSHFGNNGAAWTKKYKPINIFEIIPNCDDFDEDKYTLKYMKLLGVDNVRGGSFCSVQLSQDNKNTIDRMIKGSTDKCYKCGEHGHFTGRCKGPAVAPKIDKNACRYCNKVFGTPRGAVFHENFHCKKKTAKPVKVTKTKKSPTCNNCGRTGHYASKCYATTTVDGDYIDSEEEDSDEDWDEWEEVDEDNDDEEDIKCYRCGRKGHKSNECYAQKHVKGYYLK